MKQDSVHKNIAVVVVAEFAFHRGRQLVRQRGVGGVKVQSILVAYR